MHIQMFSIKLFQLCCMCGNFHNKTLGGKNHWNNKKSTFPDKSWWETWWMAPPVLRLSGMPMVHSVRDNYISLNPTDTPLTPCTCSEQTCRILKANTHVVLFPGCWPHSAIVTESAGAWAQGGYVANFSPSTSARISGKISWTGDRIGPQRHVTFGQT